jgi:hypothetical protein
MQPSHKLTLICKYHYIFETLSVFAFSFTASVVLLPTMKAIDSSIYNISELMSGILLMIAGYYL